MKRNKNKTKPTPKKMVVVFFSLVILTMILLSVSIALLFESKIQTEACTELLIFETEFVGYVMNTTSLDLNETMDDFVRYKVEEILKE